MSLGFGSYDQFYLSAVVLIGTYAAAAVLLWLCQHSRWSGFIQTYRGIAHNFLTVINVIFALNLAFLANDTWEARDRALDAVYREAGSLQTILDLARTLPDGPRTAVTDAVGRYVAVTVTDEWPDLARRESSPAVSERLNALMALISGPAVTTAAGSAVASQLLDQAAQVRSTRDLRIALSQTHVNPLKWLGMAFLGLLTMISIAMVHVDTPKAQLLSVLLFATAAAPSAAIILVHGNPFQHPLAISPEPIAGVAPDAAAALAPGSATPSPGPDR